MPVVDVVNLDGKKVGEVELADAVFGAKVNAHLLHEASRWYLAGLRAGTHKTKDKDGYDAAQLGLVEFVKPQRVNKALTGHFKKADVAPMKVLKEVRIEESKDETKVGDRVLVENFKAGELVDVSGVSKGKGFQGGVKRWHYAGGDNTHGSMFHRAPGGIGGSSFPSRVWPNQHFPGHMGHERVTAKNLKVVKVDTDENLLLVKGSVPGPSGRYIFIRKAKSAK